MFLINQIKNVTSGFRIQDSGFRIQDSGFRIQDSGFRIQEKCSLNHQNLIYMSKGIVNTFYPSSIQLE